jgi:hypothetical protein
MTHVSEMPPPTAVSKTLKRSPVKRVKANIASGRGSLITYTHNKGVYAFVSSVAKATPMEII